MTGRPAIPRPPAAARTKISWPVSDDWKVGAEPKRSTDGSRDNPQNQDRARRAQEDDPRGNGPKVPEGAEWWKAKKPDLSTPQNPFTPEAQEQQRQRQLQQQLERAQENSGRTSRTTVATTRLRPLTRELRSERTEMA
jgi:hypothetical protein